MLNVAVENTPYPPVLIVWKTHSLYSSMFGFIIVIVTDKIAGAVIELDRKGAIVDEFGWFIYFKSNRGL